MGEHDWMDDANCKGMDPDLFFPGRGDSIREAQAICRECDVQAECLAFAINNNEKHGIWGGLSERERRRIRRGRNGGLPLQRGPQKSPIDHGTHAGYNSHRRRGETPCADCRFAYTRHVMAARVARRNAIAAAQRVENVEERGARVISLRNRLTSSLDNRTA